MGAVRGAEFIIFRAMKEKALLASWLMARVDDIKVIRKGDEVTVIVPDDLKSLSVGLLINEALIRAGLHPNQVQ